MADAGPRFNRLLGLPFSQGRIYHFLSVFVCAALLPYALYSELMVSSSVPVVIRLERVLPSLYRTQRPSFHLTVVLPRARSHPHIGLDKIGQD
jgi:hypothetical protein